MSRASRLLVAVALLSASYVTARAQEAPPERESEGARILAANPEIVHALLARTEDEEHIVTIFHLGPGTVPLLLKELQHGQPQIRLTAASCLAYVATHEDADRVAIVGGLLDATRQADVDADSRQAYHGALHLVIRSTQPAFRANLRRQILSEDGF